jgi:DivIVA domain-containing protein
MSTNFPTVEAKELGYDPGQVDAVINQARVQFAEPFSNIIDAKKLRTSQFDLVAGGYLIAEVDAALDRLDDAFALREKQRLAASFTSVDAFDEVDKIRKLIKSRVRRPNRKKLGRVGLFAKGYSVKQVDLFLTEIGLRISGKSDLSISELRNVTFKPKWGGYVENQVDALIDKTVEYLQLSAD